MRQEHLLSVGADGGGYINLRCTNKDDLSLSILCLQADCNGASIGGQSPVGLWAAVFVVEVLAVGGWDCLRMHSGCDFSFIVKDFYQQ